MPFSKRTRLGSRRTGALLRLDLARDLAPEVRMPPREPVRQREADEPRPAPPPDDAVGRVRRWDWGR